MHASAQQAILRNLSGEEPSAGAPRTHGRTSAARTVARRANHPARRDGRSAKQFGAHLHGHTLLLAGAGVGKWAAIGGVAIGGSVTDASDAAPVERWRAACYRQDPAATNIGVHGPDWRVEPQPQQVTARVLRRVAVVEGGACMQGSG